MRLTTIDNPTWLLGSRVSREEGKEVYIRTVEAEIARLGGEGRDLRPDSPEGIRIASIWSIAEVYSRSAGQDVRDSREEGREIYARAVDARVASLGSQRRDLGPDSPESVRIASLRNLAAEAGPTLGPVTEANIEQAPELAVVEAFTGNPITQNEAKNITIAERGEQAKAVAERIRANRAARTGEPNDLRPVGRIDQATDGVQATETLASSGGNLYRFFSSAGRAFIIFLIAQNC